MNDLTTMTDRDLEFQLAIQQDRIDLFKTEEGKGVAVAEMLKLLAMLEKCGYKIDSSKKAIAKIWASKLKEQIIRIGFSGVQDATVQWIQDDRREYMSFPKVSWVEDKCKEIHGDPRVEKGRRDYQRRLDLIEKEHQEHVEKFKRDHPEEWERIKKEAEVRMNECNR